jgi:LysM repeat protein
MNTKSILNFENSNFRYYVNPGDSLWSISKKVYGDGSLWQIIYSANKEIIGRNADFIYVGTKLTIPDKSSLNNLEVVSGKSTSITSINAYARASYIILPEFEAKYSTPKEDNFFDEDSEDDTLDNVLGGIEKTHKVLHETAKSLSHNMGVTTLGSNSKLYFVTSTGHVFRGNQYVTTTSLAKVGGRAGKILGPIGIVLSLAQIGYGVYQDGWRFAYYAQKATASVAGGLAGGFVGAKLGASAGAVIGAAIGVWFFGVGAAPGAAIGGFIGGIIGGVAGALGGAYAAEKIFDKIKLW